MKKVLAAVLMGITLTACTNKQTTNEDMNTTLQLTQEWDKVFPQSDKVTHEKVTFKNRFGIELAADLYKPINADGKLPAIACSGPTHCDLYDGGEKSYIPFDKLEEFYQANLK